MLQRQERKAFPGMKEFHEAHIQWLKDFNWPLEYAWSSHDHAACAHTPGGTWKLQSFGYYLASDWNHRLYQSHRCTRCGMMVQHKHELLRIRASFGNLDPGGDV